MSSEKNDLDYPAFAVITQIMGMTDVDFIPDLYTLKNFLEDLMEDGAVTDDDTIYVCEVKDVIVPKMEMLDPFYSRTICPDDGQPLIYDESEECYFCEECDRYYYENELRAIYNY